MFMALTVALMWALEVADTVTGNALDRWGVEPRDVEELPQIYTAPLLHFGFGHLLANSVPFFLLGFLVLLGGVRPWLVTTFAAVTASGLLAWLLSAPGSITAGASGVVFGWLTYVLLRAWFTRDGRHVLIAVVVLVVYGGMLWGVLPAQAGVSWQGHLGGAIGGGLAAWWLHRVSPGRRAGRPRR